MNGKTILLVEDDPTIALIILAISALMLTLFSDPMVLQ